MLRVAHPLRVAAVFPTLLILSACNQPPPPAAAAPTVIASPPVQRDVIGRDSFTGRLEATDSVDIRARVSGYIDQVAFIDGAVVRKGDLLFVIDPRPYQAVFTQAQGQLASARSRLELAEIELARAKRLIPSGAIAANIYDQRVHEQQTARAAVATASGVFDRAQLDLSFTQVRSPMNGRISRKLVSVGNLIAGGDNSATLLTSVVSIDPIDVYFDIDEQTYLRYGRLVVEGKRPSADNLGSEVLIALPGEITPTRKGTLDFIENRLDRSTGTLRGRASVHNKDHSLNPGQFARVQLISDGGHRALLVPDAALTTDATRRVLNVVDHEDRVAVRTVQLGRLYGKLREITQGLEPQDRVIVDGLQRAQVGEKVVVQLKPVDASLATVERTQ